MKLALLFSGGKDSTLALAKASEEHEIACLISIFSRNDNSYMFHVPNIHVTLLQSEALGIPLIKQVTDGIKEEELVDLKKALIKAKQEFDVQGVVTGAIQSVYQASRIRNICKELGLECINPLWQMDQVELLNEVVDSGFKAIISGVAGYPLTKSFLGKVIDSEMISKLIGFQEKYELNPAGEGGEIETTVIDCPLFKKRIEVVDSETTYDNFSGVFYIKNARLVDKD